MANRYPLIFDADNKKIKELPIDDSLRIDGDLTIANSLKTENEFDLVIQSEQDIEIVLRENKRIKISGGVFQAPKFTEEERNQLDSEEGDIIFNTSTNSLQIFTQMSETELSWLTLAFLRDGQENIIIDGGVA